MEEPKGTGGDMSEALSEDWPLMMMQAEAPPCTPDCPTTPQNDTGAYDHHHRALRLYTSASILLVLSLLTWSATRPLFSHRKLRHGQQRGTEGRNVNEGSTEYHVLSVAEEEATPQRVHPGWPVFPQGMSPETRAVVDAIDASQNPKNCTSARYLVWNHLNNGIGSDLHTTSWALAYAMSMHRVLVYNTSRPWLYTDDMHCHGRRTSDCFLLPLTNCQDTFNAMNITDVPKYRPINITATNDAYKYQPGLRNERVVQFVWHHTELNAMVAVPLQAPGRDVSWWRAQAIRYILRPNPELYEWVTRYMETALVKVEPRSEEEKRNVTVDGTNATAAAGQGQDRLVSAALGAPPDSATCIHVRHGDKYTEMTLHPLAEYLDAAVSLTRTHNASRHVFVATDDEGVIDGIKRGKWSDRHNVTFYFLSNDRHNDLTPQQFAKSSDPVHFARMTLADIFLISHPSCTAFVMTTASNIDRVANEVRKTDGRHGAVWVDLEPGEWRRKRA